MSDIAALVAGNLDIWTSAIQRKSGAGRGGGKRISLYGIERLRALILDLAVRGKLVPQDAGDEPASELLKRMGASRRTSRKQSKRQIGQSSIEPRGWTILAFGELAEEISTGPFGTMIHKEDYVSGGIPLINPSHMIEDHIVEDSAVSLPISKAKALGAYTLRSGDIVFARRGEVGRLAIVTHREDGWLCGTGSFRARFCGSDVQPYLLKFFRSHLARSFLGGASVGATMANLNQSILSELPILLPPLAEQRRIVAKVDELMVLCDALERESTDAMAAHQALVEELVATLVNSADAADLAANWARLETHFDTLFTTDASIEALKQTILDLAVRGKLVEQHAGDEPAIKKIKGPNTKAPFVIPANWQCVPLQALGRQLGGGTPSKSRSDFWEGPIPWVSPKDMKKDYLFEAEMSVSESALTASAVKLIAPESLIFVVRGMILAHSFPVAIAKTPVTINQDMKAIELDQPAMADYLLRALKGLKPLMLARVERSSHGTCRLDSAAYATFTVPIPPLAEQQRIVAKVDALMALCDQLKTRLADAVQTQRHLADAITERAAA